MKKRWMALLGAAVVTINLFAGCGSTGAEQTGNNADGTATEAVQGKDSAGGGNAAQSVAGSADTNMSENQIKSLIRMQLGTMKGWDVQSVAAEGDSSGKQYCYSYKGKALYVTVPYESSVSKIKKKMRRALQ